MTDDTDRLRMEYRTFRAAFIKAFDLPEDISFQDLLNAPAAFAIELQAYRDTVTIPMVDLKTMGLGKVRLVDELSPTRTQPQSASEPPK